MYDRINYVFILYFKVKLFATFARKRLFWRFAGLYLATHELPQSTLRLVRRALPDKIPIAIFYDGPNDFDYVPYRHLYAQMILLPSSAIHFLFFIF